MASVLSRSRIKVSLPKHGAAPRARTVPSDRLLIGLAASFCLALWATSTKLLLASGARDGGRVLACRYFTGAGVMEWQYLIEAGEARTTEACPLVRRG